MNFCRAIVISLFSFLTCAAVGQNCYDLKHPCHPGDTLIDKYFELKFITDTSQKCLIALDWHNKIVWQTNPWEIESFQSYDSSISDSFRSNHITAFFLLGKKDKHDPYIYLRFFNSSIAAVIERKNGKFHLIGVM